MSETPETHGLPWTAQLGDSAIAHESITRGIELCGSLEIDRNRWRSVAEQAEKELREISGFTETYSESSLSFGVLNKRIKAALSAFDSLRKEESND